MNPLLTVQYEGRANRSAEDGPPILGVILTVFVPLDRVPDLSRNDTLRKETADALKNAIPQENP